jgi:arsenate reductase
MVLVRQNPNNAEKQKVLFLCSHNSARSQMAEGLLRAKYGDRYEAYSAGNEATSVDPYAIKVMNEIGIDISGYRSKNAEEFKGYLFDLAVTVCDNVQAKTMCPLCGTTLQPIPESPTARSIIHRSFEDPSAYGGLEEEKLATYRRVRDEIRDWITRIFED